MDREATSEDLDALREFARTRVGVEFFVEPETMVTDTTAVAVAADGEWTRRRVGSPQVIRQVAKQLSLPVYDVQIVGYPERMRAYNARLKASRSERMLGDQTTPPVRTSRPRPHPPTPAGGPQVTTADLHRSPWTPSTGVSGPRWAPSPAGTCRSSTRAPCPSTGRCAPRSGSSTSPTSARSRSAATVPTTPSSTPSPTTWTAWPPRAPPSTPSA